MSIELLDYQQEAIDNIFGNEKLGIKGLFNSGKRSAAVVMPTGSGKSFVSMRAIEKMMEKYKVEPTGRYPHAISEFDMLYFAPNTGILYQFRMHISEHMICPHYLEKYKENNIIEENNIKDAAKFILDSMLPDELKTSEYELDYEKILKENDITSNKSPEEIVRIIVSENLKNYDEKQLEKIALKSYPNMRFECYQNLPNLRIRDLNHKFVICDEAHRGAAKTWLPKLKRLVSQNKESYFLMTTATPDRNADDKSLIDSVAMFTGYTPEECQEGLYYAKEYYLLEAIKDGRVVNPKIVGFPCTLDETPEYQKIIKKINEFEEKKPKGGSSLYKKLITCELIRDKMDEIMGKRVDGKTLTDKEWNQKKKRLIKEILDGNGSEKTKFNRNGKYITFIPTSANTELEPEDYERLKQNPNLEASDIKSERNVKNSIKKLISILGEDVITLLYHSVNKEKDNNKSLQFFQKAKSIIGGIKSIITNKKLAEGVHVEDCDGEIMLGQIMPNAKGELSSTFLQEFGRVIRGIKPNEKMDQVKVPVVYDYANNFMRNFENLKLNGEMLLDYDQNATRTSDFFELYRIFENNPQYYSTRIENGEKTYEFEFGKRKTPMKYPNYQVRKKMLRRTAEQRYSNLIKALEILENCHIEPKLDLRNLPYDTVINDDFFYKYKIPKDEASRIKGLFIENGIISRYFKEYNIGEELSHVKKVFYGIEKDNAMKRVLKTVELDFETLSRLGVIYLSREERLLPEYRDLVDINGFIKPNRKILNNIDMPDISFLDKLVGININTGTRYYLGKDEFGCYEPGTKDEFGNDISGYDIYGYDRYGFNKDGIHRLTGQKYNEKHFSRVVQEDGSIVFINTITGKNTDVFGYNIDGINPETGFDDGLSEKNDNDDYIKHYWHKYDSRTGEFSRIFVEYDLEKDPPVDEYGAKKSQNRTDIIKYPFCKDRKSVNGNDFHDRYTGLNIDGFNRSAFKEVTIIENGREVKKFFHRDTGSEYNASGKDYKGNLEPNLEKGIEILNTIFRSGNKIKNPQYRKNLFTKLKQEYEHDGETIDDILDKALTMYRMAPLLSEDDNYSGKISYIENQIMSNEEAAEFVKIISPKFHNQIVMSTEYIRQMRETFSSKMQKLFSEIINKYEQNIPTNILTKMIDLRKKYDILNYSNILTTKTLEDSDYRDF